MRGDIVTKTLVNALEETKLDKVTFDKNAIEEVFSLNGRDLSNLSTQKIMEYIHTVETYVPYLQLNYNIKYIQYRNAKRVYERELDKVLINQQVDKKLTVKEKTAIAMSDPKLISLEDEMDAKEYEYLVFDKLPDQIHEIANSFKKELTVRGIKFQ